MWCHVRQMNTSVKPYNQFVSNSIGHAISVFFVMEMCHKLIRLCVCTHVCAGLCDLALGPGVYIYLWSIVLSKNVFSSVTFCKSSNPISASVGPNAPLTPLKVAGIQKGMLLTQCTSLGKLPFLTNYAALLYEATRWQHATTHTVLQSHLLQQCSVCLRVLQLYTIYLIEELHFLLWTI